MRRCGSHPLEQLRRQLFGTLAIRVEKYENRSLGGRLAGSELDGTLKFAFLEKALLRLGQRARDVESQSRPNYLSNATEHNGDRENFAVTLHHANDAERHRVPRTNRTTSAGPGEEAW